MIGDWARGRIRGMKRFQFILRTLFIVVTLLAIPCWYVGSHYRIVQARKQFIEEHPGAFHESDGWGRPSQSIPWIRSVLGDQRVGSVVMPDTASDEEMDRLCSLFPEVEAFRQTRPSDRFHQWTWPEKYTPRVD